MGKKLNISKSVIKFILDKRNDITTYNTFEDIRKMLKNEFNIEMSLQAVRYQYEHNKDKPIFSNLAISTIPISEDVKKETKTSEKPSFDFKAFRQKIALSSESGFDKKAGDELTSEDIAKLMSKAID